MTRIPTLFIGQNRLAFPELDSTNQYALELLSKIKPSEGTVISADFQHQGRGQIGSGWHSAPHQNLLFSCILYPHFLPVRHQFQLSQAVALAICETVQYFVQAEVKIKWPNDIYIQDKKVAGILIQNALHGKQILNSVIGVGLNVLQKTFPEVLPNPTALAHWTDQALDLEAVLSVACSNLEKWYLQLKRHQSAFIQQCYQEQMYHFAVPVLFQREGEEDSFSGKIVGTTEAGKLMVESSAGLQTFAPKELRFIHTES